MRCIPRLNLVDTEETRLAIGSHSIWWPPEPGGRFGIKIPFQFGGQVVKYRYPHEASYSRETIAEEVALLKFLHEHRAAPAIGEWVFFEEVVSEHMGALWSDPLGALGYEMEDVRVLSEPGVFTPEWLRSTGMVRGSPGAWGDLLVPERGNVINGYVIDVRRSWFDHLRYLGLVNPLPSFLEEPLDRLCSDLLSGGQFPARQRAMPYQEVLLPDGQWHRGARETRHRAECLGFTPTAGESVLDLGCCLGAFLQYAMVQGAGRCVGLDSDPRYLALARRLARACGMNICYREVDLATPVESQLRIGAEPARGVFIEDQFYTHVVEWLRELFSPRLDHLLALSMSKHISEPVLWWWVDTLGARRTYLETNAVKPGVPEERLPLMAGVRERGGVFLGYSEDRNMRALYRIDQP